VTYSRHTSGYAVKLDCVDNLIDCFSESKSWFEANDYAKTHFWTIDIHWAKTFLKDHRAYLIYPQLVFQENGPRDYDLGPIFPEKMDWDEVFDWIGQK